MLHRSGQSSIFAARIKIVITQRVRILRVLGKPRKKQELWIKIKYQFHSWSLGSCFVYVLSFLTS